MTQPEFDTLLLSPLLVFLLRMHVLIPGCARMRIPYRGCLWWAFRVLYMHVTYIEFELIGCHQSFVGGL